MAVSKSWSSGIGQASRRKVFTLSEANRTLPLVGRIVADVVTAHIAATALHTRLEYRVPAVERDAIQVELEALVDRLADLVDELKAVGCELIDYRVGLIDFVGEHNGREIHWNWQLGEPAIGSWRELHSSVTGRQPVSALRP